MCNDSTPSLVYEVKMRGRSCDYGVYGRDTPMSLDLAITIVLLPTMLLYPSDSLAMRNIPTFC